LFCTSRAVLFLSNAHSLSVDCVRTPPRSLNRLLLHVLTPSLPLSVDALALCLRLCLRPCRCVGKQTPDKLDAYGVWEVSTGGSRLKLSALAALIPLRLRHFWKAEAVGSIVRFGSSHTVALPLGCSLVLCPAGQSARPLPQPLYGVAWGFVDACVRLFTVGEPEGASGASKVNVEQL
jgi:hypothetical protein